MHYRMRLAAVLSFALISVALFSQTQQRPQRQGGRFAGLDRAMGTIKAISSGQMTLQDVDGKNIDVKLTPDTQFRKDRQEAKAGDFKAGDRVVAAGERDSSGVLVARFVMTGAMRPGMGGGPNRMGGGPNGMNRQGLGTQFIVGEVKNIDGAHLTILRPDGQQQIIEVNEDTSFRNDKNESVTLADIKVGDQVGGRGEMKNGTFVPNVLRIGIQPPSRSGQDNN